MKTNSLKWNLIGMVAVGFALWFAYITFRGPPPAIPAVKLPAPLTPEQIADQKLIVKINEEVAVARKARDRANEESALRKLSKAIGGKTGAMLGMSLDSLLDHIMHGVVLDQHKRPVGGARVRLLFTNSGFAQGRGNVSVYTDALGRFEVEGHGGAVSVMGITHPNLTRYIYAMSRIDDTVNRAGYRPFSYVNNSAEDPLVFNVMRVEEYEDVYTKRSMGIYTTATGEPTVQGNFKVTCNRKIYKGNSVKKYQLSDWVMRLEPAEPGGFIRTKDAYLNEAPVGGYDMKYLEVGYKLGEGKFKTKYSRDDIYYYKSGSTYGVFKIRFFNAFSKGNQCYADIRWDSYNREGTRNLAIPRLTEVRLRK